MAALIVVAVVGIALTMNRTNPLEDRGSNQARPGLDQGLSTPRSMAAIGDSITQAANVGFGPEDAALEHSWATGRDTGDPVVSHLERLRAAHPTAGAIAHNVSFSGARMQDALGQARAAVSQHVEYVTFLMGANDACASSPSSMTSVASFRRDFQEAIDTLVTGLPDAVVYVISIPDIYRLWEVMSDSPQARESWRLFGTCGALLGDGNRERDRLRVRTRVEHFNEVLQEVCDRHDSCHHDEGAVFRYRFTSEDVSPLDFFHPSLVGQRHLAEVTWRHGPFAGHNAP